MFSNYCLLRDWFLPEESPVIACRTLIPEHPLAGRRDLRARLLPILPTPFRRWRLAKQGSVTGSERRLGIHSASRAKYSAAWVVPVQNIWQIQHFDKLDAPSP
jgi:hypothetical protein